MAVLELSPGKRVNLAPVLDVIERVAVSVLFIRLLLTNIPVITQPGHWFNVLLLISEGICVVLLIVRHKSDDISPKFYDWLLAFGATIGPLLVQPVGGKPMIPPNVGAMLLTFGVMTQLSAKVILGRSFGIVPANRGVKVQGPYRFVRHPMYLGYVIVHIGFMLLAPSSRNVCIYICSFSLQVVRLLAEERLLACDPAYAAFMEKVRWRLLPGVF